MLLGLAWQKKETKNLAKKIWFCPAKTYKYTIQYSKSQESHTESHMLICYVFTCIICLFLQTLEWYGLRYINFGFFFIYSQGMNYFGIIFIVIHSRVRISYL